MTHVLGRPDGESGASGRFGRFLADDGSTGARVDVDLGRPHAGLLVGKRGYGKSYTLGVLAEELARTEGVTGVLADPMGVFRSLPDGLAADVRVLDPAVDPAALPPRAWCSLLDLDPTGAAGSLVWRASQQQDTIERMRTHVRETEADPAARRAAVNHLALAADWGVFDPGGLAARDLLAADLTVLELADRSEPAANAVLHAVAAGCYRDLVADGGGPLPWLLVDEAHVFFDGAAAPALETLLTRGRHPGVSLVAATQRPAALPEVAVSQADLLLAHRLTSEADLDALDAAQPTYVPGGVREYVPAGTGEVAVVDDAAESVVTVRVRERDTPHEGESPRARDRIRNG